jgi:hypothetical protein
MPNAQPTTTPETGPTINVQRRHLMRRRRTVAVSQNHTTIAGTV